MLVIGSSAVPFLETKRVLVARSGRVRLGRRSLPLTFRDRRKSHIAVDCGLYAGHVDAVGERQRVAIDLRTTDHE